MPQNLKDNQPQNSGNVIDLRKRFQPDNPVDFKARERSAEPAKVLPMPGNPNTRQASQAEDSSSRSQEPIGEGVKTQEETQERVAENREADSQEAAEIQNVQAQAEQAERDQSLFEIDEESQATEEEIEDLYAQAETLRKQGQKYKKPSKLKYGVLYLLAITSDLIDSLELTGVGAVITFFTGGAIATLIIFIFWLTDSEYKSAEAYKERAQTFIKELGPKLESIDKGMARMLSRASKKSRIARLVLNKKTKLGRLARRGMAKSLKFIRGLKKAKNPVVKSVFGSFLNLIPFVKILPFQTIGIYLSYRDEKNALAMAAKTAEEVFAEASESIAEKEEEKQETVAELKKAA